MSYARIGCLVTLWCVGTAWAQAVDVPNGSFEDGNGTPADWTLSGGEGAWTTDAPDGQHAISVTGTGKPGDTNFWRSAALPLEPSTVYRLQFQARQVSGSGGCPTSGPVFCNRDLAGLAEEWTAFTSYFTTPRDLTPDLAWLRFGQWEVNGTVAYDAVALTVAQPVYCLKNGIALGEGERITGAQYVFDAPFNSAALNGSRCLAYDRCSFNMPRWVFGADSEVVYHHRVGDLKQIAAHVDITVNYYTGGQLIVEAGPDGQTWREIGTASDLSTISADIPSDLLPAPEVWVRLSARAKEKVGGNSDPGSFQVNRYAYSATLDGAPGDLQGTTQYVATPESDPRLHVTLQTFGEGVPGGDNELIMEIENTSAETLSLRPSILLTPAEGAPARVGVKTKVAPGRHEVRIPYKVNGTGLIDVAVTLGDDIPYRAETSFAVSSLYNSAYGEVLPGSSASVGLWWASSGWKIGRVRPLPETHGAALRIQTAKNEAEAAQLVVRPAAALKGFLATGAALAGPNGAVIPAENVEVLRVGYVPVTQPTDKVGCVAPWPDPLPPFKGGIDVAANTNQPIWVRVKPPRDVPAGLYTGAIALTAEGYSATVPVEVTVFDFTLPDRMTCVSAFGFNLGRVFQYQKLTDPEQQRLVYDKYLAALSAHHISIYDPAALDSFGVSWPSVTKWDGGVRDETEKHDGAASLLLKDDTDEQSVSALYQDLMPIPEKGVALRFWYKTGAAGQPFIVTLLHHDANGQWMTGRNNDIHIEGSGEWQLFEQTIDQFPEGAKSFQLRLWAAPYAEDNSTLGTVWYDDLAVTDAGTGAVLIKGDFEPLTPQDLEALKPQFDWTAWDAAMTRAMDEYHFNAFAVPIQGMGGGTFHARYEPSLLGYGENTPEYKAAFTAYCGGLQEHLREKGWLGDAFVYWFDEPDPKDYEFVMNGFRKIKEAAPGIGRMLTEQVEPELVGGPNIWCPLTPSWNDKLANERRADGDRFWWYVCTGPKEPYATLFIDHPATELRVWLWQTWKRRIDGILIWETNYWTSIAAYPDSASPQNPYTDPMGWVSGYSTPAGTKQAWGNGDGRFMYPPEAAADGQPAEPVLDGPVDSIRFEMLRDGIEDYEYMVLLDKLLAQHRDSLSGPERLAYEKLLDVPSEVSLDLTHFTLDPAPIEAHRAAVAAAVEELSRR